MVRFYSAPTGNCHRVSIMLEEIGDPYDVVRMDFATGDFQSPDFLAINPVGQVPAISDDDGPGGKTLPLAESSAILVYLARKAGRFSPEGATEQIAADYWVALIGGVQGALTTIFFARRLDAVSHAAIIDKLLADTNRYLRAIEAWRAGIAARPAVQRGLAVPG